MKDIIRNIGDEKLRIITTIYDNINVSKGLDSEINRYSRKYTQRLDASSIDELSDLGLTQSEIQAIQDHFRGKYVGGIPDFGLPSMPNKEKKCTCGIAATIKDATLKMHDSWCDLVELKEDESNNKYVVSLPKGYSIRHPSTGVINITWDAEDAD